MSRAEHHRPHRDRSSIFGAFFVFFSNLFIYGSGRTEDGGRYCRIRLRCPVTMIQREPRERKTRFHRACIKRVVAIAATTTTSQLTTTTTTTVRNLICYNSWLSVTVRLLWKFAIVVCWQLARSLT